ncbi:MAG: DUF4129 domain-containing protein [Chloroflexi bacterium]|nr:DUF4129 domain-containing protein [Chloroflexota bacterium]
MTRLLPAVIVLLELLWSYSALVAVSEWGWIGWNSPPISLPGAIAVAAIALAPAMLVESGSWSAERLRAFILPVQVALLILVVRIDLSGGYGLFDFDWFSYIGGDISFVVGAAAYGVFLLWRGISVTAELPSMETLHRRFLLGLVAILMAFVFAMVTDESGDGRHPLVSLGVYGVAYFGAGMLSVALATLHNIRREMQRRSDDAAPSLRQWMVFPVVVVTAMVIVSLLVSAVFSFDIAALLLIPITLVAKGVTAIILYGIIWPLGFVAGGLIWLLQKLGGAVEPQPDEEGGGPVQLTEEGASFPEDTAGFMLPDGVVLAIEWAVGIIAAIVVILILYKALSKFRRGEKEEDEEGDSESLGAWEGMKGDLQTFLATILGWFKRRRDPAAQPPPVPASVTASVEDLREFTIKEIYQGLLWEGGAIGRPRRTAETPYEYESRMEPLDTTQEHALDAITEAYVASRYGGLEPAPDDLRLLNRMWRGLKGIIMQAGQIPPKR